MDYEIAWQFETASFRTELRIYPCTDDPADSFDMPEDVEAIRSGIVAWFDAAVCVVDKDSSCVVGRDSLGGCAYSSVAEFYESHRDRDPMNRNSSIMRAAKDSNVVICHCFPSMVQEALHDARANVRRLCTAVKHT